MPSQAARPTGRSGIGPELPRGPGGGADSNISFAELCRLLVRLAFDERVNCEHHIFTRADVAEIINLQPKGSNAKAYQVKQVREILVKHWLGESDVD